MKLDEDLVLWRERVCVRVEAIIPYQVHPQASIPTWLPSCTQLGFDAVDRCRPPRALKNA